MPDRIECFGGPQDGERITDRGLFFRCVGRVDPHTGTLQPGTSGTYVRHRDGYHWEADP